MRGKARIAEPLQSQSGSALLPALIMTCMMCVVMAQTMQDSETLLQLGNRARGDLTTANVAESVLILYHDSADCQASLLGTSFATALQNKISDSTFVPPPTLALQYPVAAGQTAQSLASQNQAIEGVVVQNVSMPSSAQIQPSGTGYVVDVRIAFQAGTGANSAAPYPIDLPFYIITNATGTITGCYVSAYVGPGSTQTVEDQNCQITTGGKQNTWDPSAAACI
jgi:hypothetical protein